MAAIADPSIIDQKLIYSRENSNFNRVARKQPVNQIAVMRRNGEGHLSYAWRLWNAGQEAAKFCDESPLQRQKSLSRLQTDFIQSILLPEIQKNFRMAERIFDSAYFDRDIDAAFQVAIQLARYFKGPRFKESDKQAISLLQVISTRDDPGYMPSKVSYEPNCYYDYNGLVQKAASLLSVIGESGKGIRPLAITGMFIHRSS